MRTLIPVPDSSVVRARIILALTTLLCVLCSSTTIAADDGLVSVRAARPASTQSPQDVVQLQLTALGLNQELGDDDGIKIAFRFASDSNKVATGPIDKFIGILQNPLYKPMLEYESVEFGESRTHGDDVGVMVKLTMVSGENAGYVFVLSRQAHEQCQCWMTDRVMRVPLENDTTSSGSSI